MLTEEKLTSLLIERAQSDLITQQVLLGINWTIFQAQSASATSSVGLCFSPINIPRNLPWSGTLAGQPVNELSRWFASDNPCEAAIGLAAVNAVINQSDNSLIQKSLPLMVNDNFHLSVFDYFSEQLTDARVIIIGRYPGLDRYKKQFNFQCIERRPGPDDLPESAAKTELPKADWVFITASSIANKTLPSLLSYCQNAKVVLMGPTMPWLAEWEEFGVDYLAGVEVMDVQRLYQIVAEAGGTRIFEDAVRYRVLAF